MALFWSCKYKENIMSVINDYEITVHEKGVANANEYAPCSINVQHIFMSTAIKEPNEELAKITERAESYTRLDLTHPFNKTGRIITAARGANGTFDAQSYDAQSSLMTLETAEEIATLKTKAQEAHIEFLKKHRAFII
jgi:hypothetical protein